MDKFQEQIMINNLESNDISELPLETILSYARSINSSDLSKDTKIKYIAQIRNIMTSVRRSPKDSLLIAKIAYALNTYGYSSYG